HDVARGVGDARDAAARPVRVPALVAEDDPALGLELVQGPVVRDELAVLVLQRDRDALPGRAVARPRRVRVLDHEDLLAAHEVQVVVLDHRPREQVRLGEDLEAVADAEDGHTALRRVDDRLHDRREAADRARAQVVAVREAAGQDDGVHAVQVRVRVPQRHGLAAREAHRARRVAVVEGAGERDDTDLGRRESRGGHQARPWDVTVAAASASMSATRTTSSITGFDRSVTAACSAAARTSGVTSPSTSSSNRLPWRTDVNWVKPRRGSAPTTALPCGSRISGLGMTATATRPT